MFKEQSYFRKRKILKNANYLHLTPVRKFGHKTDENGNIIILIPRFKGPLGQKFLQPRLRHPYITLELDELGSDTWLLADGKRKVHEICSLLKEKYHDNLRQAEERVTRFYSRLYLQKLITFNEILK